MIPAHIQSALIQIESHFNDLSLALLSGEPLALEAPSVALRQTAIDFSALVQRLSLAERKEPQLALRLKALSDGLVSRRESLIRRAVLVERELNTIVPATRGATYSPATGPYGRAGKQSGAFKQFSA